MADAIRDRGAAVYEGLSRRASPRAVAAHAYGSCDRRDAGRAAAPQRPDRRAPAPTTTARAAARRRTTAVRARRSATPTPSIGGISGHPDPARAARDRSRE